MKGIRRTKQSLGSCALGLVIFAAAQGQATATPLDLSSKPLFLKSGVAPNVIVTLDDSGSMGSEYMPDDRYGSYDLRYYSPTYNSIAYNPNVNYQAPVDANESPLSTSFTDAWENGITQSGGSRNLSNNYLGYDVDGDGNNETAAFYSVWDANNSNCSGSISDNDCYDKVLVSSTSGPAGTDERQNFANWYSFYRSRNLATISSASLAFAQMGGQIRIGWQRLNTSNTITGVRAFTGSHRQDFYDWLFALPHSGGTPLRAAMQRAGEYYETTEPYLEDPTDSTSAKAACRQNYHVLMSDGVWNGYLGNGPGNYDKPNSAITLPDNASYSGRAPYQDDNSNYLADLALQFWATDLSSLPDDVPTYMPVRSGTSDENYWNAKNDPADWQHMTNFTVGLGLGSVLTDPAWGGSTYAGDYDSLVDGTASWPTSGSDEVYDMWHAAINSRGQFFSADDPQALANAFREIVERIADRSATASSVTIDSGSLASATTVYISRFNSRNWTGKLVAFDLTSTGGIGTAQWDAACALDGGSCSTDGNTYTGKTATARRIVTTNGDSGTGVPFRWTDLASSQTTALNAGDSAGSARLDYLRGDHSSEEDNGGSFRNRDSKLGDIVHASPVFVGAPKRFYPDDWDDKTTSSKENTPEDAATGTYSDFKSAHASRSGVLYMGANDGMLHAFDATNGEELFAFVPGTVYDKLADLTDPAYAHDYFVDGTPSEGDAFFNDTDNAWHTVLVGGLGAGGQGIYALDITDVPSASANESTIADKVLWEFTDANDADLGATFSKPQIVRLHNGEWAAVFGNGYNNTLTDGNASSTGDAVLYLVDIEDGSLIRKIDTEVGSADDPTGNNRPNGLATPALADVDGDSMVDYAYAGDLYGNMWKFDLRDTSETGWQVMYSQGGSPEPLFVAERSGTRQPITTQPSIRRHPVDDGYMVMFGTGKYIEDGDEIASSDVQSVYGIWDRDEFSGGGSNPSPTLTTFDRSNLLEQTIDQELTASGDEYRVVSQNPINWADKDNTYSSGEHVGWYLDLLPSGGTPQGEMQVTDTLVRGGRLIFTTLIPNNDPCSLGGDSWLMVTNWKTGGRFNDSSFDVNNDGVFDVSDLVDANGDGNAETAVSGKKKGGVRSAPTMAAGQEVDRVYTGQEGNTPDCEGEDCDDINRDASVRNRQSWRQAR